MNIQENQSSSSLRYLTLAIAMAVIVPFLRLESLNAQSVCLPLPRLLTIMPMGGQSGTEVEVALTGELLDKTSRLVFSDPRITAKLKQDEDSKTKTLKFVVSIPENLSEGLYEARVLTASGISSPRAFTVSRFKETQYSEPATTAQAARPIELNSIGNAVMTERSIDHYRFSAKDGQRIVVDLAARGIDSKLTPVVIVADSSGRDLLVERRGDVIVFDVPEDGDYLVKVHDLTFGGGAHYFYRLIVREDKIASDVGNEVAGMKPARLPSTKSVHQFSWPPVGLAAVAGENEVEPNDDRSHPQRIKLPCDVSGVFGKAADADVFEFEAKKGEHWCVEVASHRLGHPTDPVVVVQQVVEKDGAKAFKDLVEIEDIASPVKVSTNRYAYDGPPYNVGSSDALGRIEIPEDGVYQIQLSDAFGGTREDPRNRYRLVVRRPQPDFAVAAWRLHMELRNGDRNALSKPLAVRPGATVPLEVVAIRRDGFTGPIELEMTSLPDGVSAQGLTIGENESRGILLLSADEGAPPGFTQAVFMASASIDGKTAKRPVSLATMKWPVKDGRQEIPQPRLVADLPVSVSGTELEAMTISPQKDMVYQATEGEKLSIPLVHFRRSEFSGAAATMKTFGAGFEKNPTFELSLKDDKSEAVVDLAKLKTKPGTYEIAFYGRAVVKYAPPDSEPNSTKKPKTKDTVDIFVSKPVTIRVSSKKNETVESNEDDASSIAKATTSNSGAK